jgi:hypothetical protein
MLLPGDTGMYIDTGKGGSASDFQPVPPAAALAGTNLEYKPSLGQGTVRPFPFSPS